MRTRGAVMSVAVAGAGVLLAAGALPAVAQAPGTASVVNRRATMDDGGGVPVKVHCAAAKAKRCTGNLRWVSEVAPGTTVASFLAPFAVPGGKTRTIRIQASGSQIELLLQAGTLAGVVNIKEKKPRARPVHSSPLTVRLPS